MPRGCGVGLLLNVVAAGQGCVGAGGVVA
jgi:lipoprotein